MVKNPIHMDGQPLSKEYDNSAIQTKDFFPKLNGKAVVN